MYRVIAIVVRRARSRGVFVDAGLAESQRVQAAARARHRAFRIQPPGAEAKTSNGQTCRTPCALALPTEAPLTVTFTLNGYLPDTETLDPISIDRQPDRRLQPNPVLVELAPAPPPPKPVKPVKKKPVAKKKARRRQEAGRAQAGTPRHQPAAPAPQPAGVALAGASPA